MEIKELIASIIIPNWNGKDLLAKCLPSVIKASECSDQVSEIIIVDDGSTDASVEFIKERFPKIRLISLKNNLGFGAACNTGVAASKSPVVILLNNDVSVKRDFVVPLLDCFADDSVFAVQPKILQWDTNELDGGINFGGIDKGYIRIKNEAETSKKEQVTQRCATLYAIGGAMVFDRKKWGILGGFDSLYEPFCWEDIDICYRAQKRGWKVFYEPDSVVYHKHHATLHRFFAPDFIRKVETKNELLFTWKNIHDKDLFIRHFIFLPIRLLRAFILMDFIFIKALVMALTQLQDVYFKREREKASSIISDSQVFGNILVNKGYVL